MLKTITYHIKHIQASFFLWMNFQRNICWKSYIFFGLILINLIMWMFVCMKSEFRIVFLHKKLHRIIFFKCIISDIFIIFWENFVWRKHFPKKYSLVDFFLLIISALQVLRAETRLTVYRALSILFWYQVLTHFWKWYFFLIFFDKFEDICKFIY